MLDPSAKARLVQFVALLIYGGGEEQVAKAFAQVSEGTNLPYMPHATEAAEQYVDDILNP